MDLIIPGYGLMLWQLSGLLLIGLWVYTLFDCLRSEFVEPNQKLIWVILIVFVPFLGPLMYLGLSKKGKVKRSFQADFTRFSSDKFKKK
ncbi:PLD nuclease N-terminal domain-containing protein [Algoriphagus aquatilis]|jgi:hypothetical protein|uniref:PLD nuclease N-terminal domain-containing protein n=1 Tax=Algoriphagus aquatilis TaxID=490186 RepID=A0ABW0BWB4_9BACT